MSTEKQGCITKEMLKNLSCNNGWCYGAFWRYNEQNSLLLTLQEAYYEDQMGVLIHDMLLQVHMLGEGLIGRAAFAKKHQYIFSDAHQSMQNPIVSAEACEVLQDDSEFFGQFATGIKTIAVIPVEPLGVLQFGSFQKLPERMEFVNQTKVLFCEVMNGGGLIGMEDKCSSSNDEICGPSGLFASLISGANSLFGSSVYLYGAGEKELMEATLSPTNLIQTFLSSPNDQQMNPIETQVNFDGYISNSIQPQGSFPQPACHLDYSINDAPCSSMWGCEDSALTSSLKPFPSQILPINYHEQLSTKNAQDSLTSLFFPGNLISNWDSTSWLHSSESKLQGPTNPCTFEEFFHENDIANAFPRSCPVNEFSQLLSAMPDQSNKTAAITLNKNLSHERGLTSASSNFKEDAKQILENFPSNSVQSSITNLCSSVENEKYADMSGIGKLLDGLRANSGCRMSENWSNISIPAVSGGFLDSGAIYSKCTPKPPNKLFSGSGISQCFDDVTSSSCSVAISSLEDQLSSASKRRKIETSFSSSDQVKFTSFPMFDGNRNSMLPHKLEKMNNLGHKNDGIHKLEMDSLVDDSYGINAGKVSQLKQHEQLPKNVKKKAKPGTRPRPKDRQQIHDRLLELRKLILNGEKMSIDCLLHQTIKQLLFLQSLSEHAERLKEIDEPKDRTVPENVSSSHDSGVTWACEVGDETVICPLIVEDLNTPGQMSIQIQCEERGSCLEIVEIIRGFGLSILKGLMETREAKIYARFTVAAEGNRHVTRHEIFSSLLQLLQFSSSSATNTSDQLGDIVNGGAAAALFNTSQHSTVPLPINMAETLQCGNL